MSEAAIEKKKRFRSPAYPALDLSKAVERAASLMKTAHHHSVGIPVVLQAWGMDSDAGPVWRYLAALIQYGLVTSSGTGTARKFQVTEPARRIIQDSDPNSTKRKEALRAAALSPTIHKELWEKFGHATDLSDAVLKTYLTLDRVEAGEAPYSDASSADVIQTYRASLGYAGLSKSDTTTTTANPKTPSNGQPEPDRPSKVKVGDFVQWTSGGVDQLPQPRKVTAISGRHAFVHGSATGIPLEQLTVVDPPKPTLGDSANSAYKAASGDDISVLLVGNRLQITADVNEAGVAKLKQMLDKYQEILKLLQ